MNTDFYDTLLASCRNELQITWEDSEIDTRIVSHIKNGIRHIRNITGATDYDFMTGGRANALLLAYVRRGMSGDISEFDNDYKWEIIGLQTDYEVENYDEE